MRCTEGSLHADRRFAFNLILPCTLPVHDYHGPAPTYNTISYRAHSQLVAISSRPPKEKPNPVDAFTSDNAPTPTFVSVKLDAGVTRVIYESSARLRVAHMSERDANFDTLNFERQGLAENLGVYNIKLQSDIVSDSFYIS